MSPPLTPHTHPHLVSGLFSHPPLWSLVQCIWPPSIFSHCLYTIHEIWYLAIFGMAPQKLGLKYQMFQARFIMEITHWKQTFLHFFVDCGLCWWFGGLYSIMIKCRQQLCWWWWWWWWRLCKTWGKSSCCPVAVNRLSLSCPPTPTHPPGRSIVLYYIAIPTLMNWRQSHIHPAMPK